MDSNVFFKYWYAPLWSIVSLGGGYGIAILLQNRLFRRDEKVREKEKEAEEKSRRPNPIELDILRHCVEQPPADGKYHFLGCAGEGHINERPVKNYLFRAIRDNLYSLREKKYIDIFCEFELDLSFTMIVDSKELARVIKEAENRR